MKIVYWTAVSGVCALRSKTIDFFPWGSENAALWFDLIFATPWYSIEPLALDVSFSACRLFTVWRVKGPCCYSSSFWIWTNARQANKDWYECTACVAVFCNMVLAWKRGEVNNRRPSPVASTHTIQPLLSPEKITRIRAQKVDGFFF